MSSSKMTPPSPFKPALLIVDLQEDFCPPNGSLAVPSGRAIVPLINRLLSLPFALKIATKDWHPADHISFAANHAGATPFTSFASVSNPLNPAERYSSRLWPVHCVQGTPGARLVAELHAAHLDRVVEKGQEARVEMYSAFADAFERPRGCDSGLAGALRAEGVTDVFVVGLAFEYCVKSTAVDSRREGFRTWVLREGTRAVDGAEEVWEATVRELEGKGVRVVSCEGEEVGWVERLER